MEEWKDIEGFEDLYKVSNFGRVKSLERKVRCKNGRILTVKERILKPHVKKDGYLDIELSKDGKKFFKLLNRLVYKTFVGDIPKGMQVNHKDENKENNHVENLNILTPRDNLNWGTHNQRMADTLRNGILSKHAYQYTLDLVLVKIWQSTNECHRNGFSGSAISRCCNNNYMRKGNNVYKGYIWSYEKIK